MDKQKRYLEISRQICELAGGVENMSGVAHCATRLRIVLTDTGAAQLDKLEDVDLVKGVFIAGDQLQLIFGAGLVNDVYEVFSKYTHMENMSLSDVKAQSARKQNPIQRVIKSLSDVFVDIIPGILAAALFMGITSVLSQWDVVEQNPSLFAINRLLSLASTGIFAILPLAICYSATKRYGGKPILGIVVGAIMLDGSLANAYAVGNGTAVPEMLHLFGLDIEMVGFQGGIIIALMMGFVVAGLDKFFDRKIPDVIKLLVSPLLTVFVSTLLLFAVVGPAGRALSNLISGSLIWMTNHLGVVGYMVFGGLQQIIVITGLHHIIGAVEAQLIADTGRNFLNPLMSVALMGQGGAVLGYLMLHWNDLKAREICIPSFASTLFGISEPAIFGVNLRYRYPLIGGCVGGALAGAYVYAANLAALGFGTTAVPGLAIADPAGHGYANYAIAHAIALLAGIACTLILGRVSMKKSAAASADGQAKAQDAPGNDGMAMTQDASGNDGMTKAQDALGNDGMTKAQDALGNDGMTGLAAERPEEPCAEGELSITSPMAGAVGHISQSGDPTFASGVLGEGITIQPADGQVFAPCDAQVLFIADTKHAVGMRFPDGSEAIIHCGIDTVELKGEGFEILVENGRAVKRGEPLLRFDHQVLKSHGLSPQTVLAFSSIADGRRLEILPNPGADPSTVVARLYPAQESGVAR